MDKLECNANLIYGFKLEIKIINKLVTKYNEDTGEPYQKKIYSHKEALIGDCIIASTKENDHALYFNEKYGDLYLYSIYSGGDASYYLGLSVATVNNYEMNMYETEVQIKKSYLISVDELGNRLGITPEYYLILEEEC